MMEPLLHTKIRDSECLTTDRSTAALVYVPYYATLCLRRTSLRVSGGVNQRLPLAENGALRKLEARLREHLLRTEPELLDCPERYVLGVGSFLKNVFLHHTFLTRWERPFRRIGLLMMELLGSAGSLRAVRKRYPGAMAVPYPSNFDAPIPPRARTSAIAAAFGLDDGVDANLRLRAELRRQCVAQPAACTWLDLRGLHARSMSASGPNAAVLDAYERHAYCLQPAGDSLTRKGIFDALGAGCIPVGFDERSFTQYRHYLGDNAAAVARFTVVLPRNATARAVEELTARHRRGDDAAQRAAIARAWWSFQYDAAPLRLPRRTSAARCDAACVALRAARRNAATAGCAPRAKDKFS